ncbi:MAG: helix-turn-helix domain-containing protein, partial [Actinomycetota bacterium]|nr:helix-turn-helix domain-containing protein [Actinomycetota bacterium]
MADGDPVSLTIRDASRATGLSIKALRRRVERGTLPAQVVDGVRRVPVSALLGAGLLVTRAAPQPTAG